LIKSIAMTTICGLAAQVTQVEERLLVRNRIVEEFFSREASRLAEACQSMSERFLNGGRLLAFGRGPYATDAQHVSVDLFIP
jgi:D-sedoheptulose 7-phosphate isomerase